MSVTMVNGSQSPLFKTERVDTMQGAALGNLKNNSNPYQNKQVQQVSAMLNNRADTVEISKEAFELQLRQLEKEKRTTNANDFGQVLKAISKAMEDIPKYLEAIEFHVNGLHDTSLTDENHQFSREEIEKFSQAINSIASVVSDASLNQFTMNGSGLVRTAASKSGIDFEGFRLSIEDLDLTNLHELPEEEALAKLDAARESVAEQQSIIRTVIPAYERMVQKEEIRVEEVEPRKKAELNALDASIYLMVDHELLKMLNTQPFEEVEEKVEEPVEKKEKIVEKEEKVRE